MRDIGRERLMISISCLTIIESAYELAVDYVKHRHAFGKPLIKKQEIRHILGKVNTNRSFYFDIILKRSRVFSIFYG